MTDGIVNLKGKRYYTVARRVHDFRAACSIADGWGLVSSMVSIDAETIAHGDHRLARLAKRAQERRR